MPVTCIEPSSESSCSENSIWWEELDKSVQGVANETIDSVSDSSSDNCENVTGLEMKNSHPKLKTDIVTKPQTHKSDEITTVKNNKLEMFSGSISFSETSDENSEREDGETRSAPIKNLIVKSERPVHSISDESDSNSVGDITSSTEKIVNADMTTNKSSFLLDGVMLDTTPSLSFEITEEEDVWMMQCPLSITESQLKGQTLNFNGVTSIQNFEGNIINNNFNHQRLNMLLPTKPFKLQAVKPVGHIVFTEKVAVPQVVTPANTKKEVILLPSGLKYRHPLFGIGYFDVNPKHITAHKKKKKRNSMLLHEVSDTPLNYQHAGNLNSFPVNGKSENIHLNEYERLEQASDSALDVHFSKYKKMSKNYSNEEPPKKKIKLEENAANKELSDTSPKSQNLVELSSVKLKKKHRSQNRDDGDYLSTNSIQPFCTPRKKKYKEEIPSNTLNLVSGFRDTDSTSCVAYFSSKKKKLAKINDALYQEVRDNIEIDSKHEGSITDIAISGHQKENGSRYNSSKSNSSHSLDTPAVQNLIKKKKSKVCNTLSLDIPEIETANVYKKNKTKTNQVNTSLVSDNTFSSQEGPNLSPRKKYVKREKTNLSEDSFSNICHKTDIKDFSSSAGEKYFETVTDTTHQTDFSLTQFANDTEAFKNNSGSSAKKKNKKNKYENVKLNDFDVDNYFYKEKKSKLVEMDQYENSLSEVVNRSTILMPEIKKRKKIKKETSDISNTSISEASSIDFIDGSSSKFNQTILHCDSEQHNFYQGAQKKIKKRKKEKTESVLKNATDTHWNVFAVSGERDHVNWSSDNMMNSGECVVEELVNPEMASSVEFIRPSHKKKKIKKEPLSDNPESECTLNEVLSYKSKPCKKHKEKKYETTENTSVIQQ